MKNILILALLVSSPSLAFASNCGHLRSEKARYQCQLAKGELTKAEFDVVTHPENVVQRPEPPSRCAGIDDESKFLRCQFNNGELSKAEYETLLGNVEE